MPKKLEDSFINLTGHINRETQVFIEKMYFHHNFDLFKNKLFPQFLLIFCAKFTQKAQNIFLIKHVLKLKTSQELRMLSNVTLNCQVAKIVMNSGPHLSEL